MSYALILLFVFWVLFKVGKFYHFRLLELTDNKSAWIDLLLLFTFAGLGTYVFHCVY